MMRRAKAGWEFPRCKMRGGERCDHWNVGKSALEREDGFDPFADDGEAIDGAEAHSITENGAERASREATFALAFRAGSRKVR